MSRKNAKICMFHHSISQASSNTQLGGTTAADEGYLEVGMKGMILYKSNIIQKHSGGKGKEILQLADPWHLQIQPRKEWCLEMGLGEGASMRFLKNTEGFRVGWVEAPRRVSSRSSEVPGSEGEQ